MMDIASNLRLRIRTQNQTIEAVVDQIRKSDSDDIGALYYVVAVVLIYGLSIVMMIASHIRKNKQDNQLRTYLKEMAILRKKDRREKLVGKMTSITPFIPKSNVIDIPNVFPNTVLGNKAEIKSHQTPKVVAEVPEIDEDYLQKNSNSDGTNDSVFQLNYDDVYENSSTKFDTENGVKQDARPHCLLKIANEQTTL